MPSLKLHKTRKGSGFRGERCRGLRSTRRLDRVQGLGSLGLGLGVRVPTPHEALTKMKIRVRV